MHSASSRVLAATAAAALAVSGCSGSSTDERRLTFASYGSAYQDAQNEALIDPWSAESDTTVTNDSPTSYPKIKQMVDANQVTWDVIDTEPFYPVANCGTYVEKLDLSAIDVSKFPEGTVSDCAIPFAQYSTVMVYDTETYPQGPTSYADFFDVEKFPGVRMVPNWAGGGALELALLADGVAPENLYPLDLKRAFSKLDTIRDSLRFWNTSSESQQALEDGTVDMAYVWSGRAYEAEKNGAALTPVWDNNLLAWASLSIVKGTKNREAAQSLIEYAATAEPQARFAELQPYSPANSDAAPQLDELQQKYNVADPQIQKQAVVTDVRYWAENNDAANKAWTEWSTS
ncbi:extracellular solute-binding protein [Mycolicibacterium litorale]|uniref:ABC transporter substrate-binding protein n=1 Tax=Mycolicibacterium litorale TaxID=758802 RepID=UPI0039A34D52